MANKWQLFGKSQIFYRKYVRLFTDFYSHFFYMIKKN